MSELVIADGEYRVVTGKGDYFVTVKSNAVEITGAIGLDGEPTEWNQNDYANVFGTSPLAKPYAWLPLELPDFAGAVQVDHLTDEEVDQVLGIFEKGEK